MPNESTITARQQSFIRSLAAGRDLPPTMAATVDRAIDGDITRRDASALIDALKTIPQTGPRNRTLPTAKGSTT